MTYEKSMFIDRHETSFESAKVVLKLMKHEFPYIDRILDVGCGVGTFLKTAKDMGISFTQGMDGPWIDSELLQIPQSDFLEVDLNDLPGLKERFDLVICLEVAEHLLENSAEALVKFLTDHAEIVLFSAAVPGQGGNHHINERWQSYWAGIFLKFGFQPVDIIRPKIWENPNISYWYKQNTLVYVSSTRILEKLPTNVTLDIVHPDMYLAHLRNSLTLKKALKLLPKSVFSQLFKYPKRIFQLK